MKLYATTTSERASKGQGGNEYLHIEIKVNDKINNFADLWVYPDGSIELFNSKKVSMFISNAVEFTESKGKQKKDEHGKFCAHCETYNDQNNVISGIEYCPNCNEPQ